MNYILLSLITSTYAVCPGGLFIPETTTATNQQVSYLTTATVYNLDVTTTYNHQSPPPYTAAADYYFSTSNANWNTAKAFCEGISMELISILYVEEDNYIRSQSKNGWIGFEE